VLVRGVGWGAGLALLYFLACSGKLEYDVAAFQAGSAGATPRPPTTEPPPSTPPATTPPPAMPPPATMPPATTPPATEPPPMMVSPCPEGTDALALLVARCGDCHDAQDRAKGLDLVTPGVAARLVGVKSACGDKLLLDPSGPTAAGQLLDKLRGPVANCGAQMPYGMPPLTAQEKACVAAWADQAIARTKGGY
jgi:hypothetical protein